MRDLFYLIEMEETIMAFSKNELILDRVRSLTARDLSTDELLFRLTSLEEPTLNCTAEGEEVVDAVGSLITTLYRAKKATFSATNSLISLDLAAAQYGTKKVVASDDNKIIDRDYEIITIPAGATEITLKRKPVGDIPYIYSIANNEVGTAYAAGAAASDLEFVQGEDGKITLPTGLTGKVYVEYDFETNSAVQIRNMAHEFPEACKVTIFAYFRDKCNENLLYSGKILCPRAKLNPEQVELALTSTGKHAFELVMMSEYCEEENELFTIVVSDN